MKIFISKADQEIEVDVDNMPKNSFLYVVTYGLTQSLSDAAASINGEDPNVESLTMALVHKRLDRLMAGTPPAIGTRAGGGNPIKKRAIEIFLERVVKPRWAKAGRKADPKVQRQEAIEGVKKNGAYIDIAAKQLEREAADVAEISAAEAAAIDAAMEGLVPKADEPIDENAVL